jgi:DNA-binding transcriptional MerR regulator
MEDDGPLLSIGELARRAGLPVRTIRFWSDAGVLPPAARTEGGRRVYDAACVARLELIVTLRELGLGLPDVRRVLDGQVSVAEVAAVHLEALDAQIRALRLHRAVLAVVVKRAADKEEMTLMNKLARMSVAERRQMIDDFLAEVFVGIDAARAPRWGAAWNLPDDPSPEQVDAWVELAEMVSDPDFRQRMRQVQDIGRQVDAREGLQDFLGWAQNNAVAAVLRGCPPDSAEAAQVLSRVLEPVPGMHPVDREELIAGFCQARRSRSPRRPQRAAHRVPGRTPARHPGTADKRRPTGPVPAHGQVPRARLHGHRARLPAAGRARD